MFCPWFPRNELDPNYGLGGACGPGAGGTPVSLLGTCKCKIQGRNFPIYVSFISAYRNNKTHT